MEQRERITANDQVGENDSDASRPLGSVADAQENIGDRIAMSSTETAKGAELPQSVENNSTAADDWKYNIRIALAVIVPSTAVVVSTVGAINALKNNDSLTAGGFILGYLAMAFGLLAIPRKPVK